MSCTASLAVLSSWKEVQFETTRLWFSLQSELEKKAFLYKYHNITYWVFSLIRDPYSPPPPLKWQLCQNKTLAHQWKTFTTFIWTMKILNDNEDLTYLFLNFCFVCETLTHVFMCVWERSRGKIKRGKIFVKNLASSTKSLKSPY